MSYNFNQGFQYYDHFTMKEVPGFKMVQSDWNKEISLLNKEVNYTIKDLEKINSLKFGLAIEEKSFALLHMLKDYMVMIREYQTSMNRAILLLSSEKTAVEQNRWEFKKSFQSKITELKNLMNELEPVKREAESFTEAVFFIFHNYAKRKASSRINLDLLRPVGNILQPVFQPLIRIVQSGLQLSHS